MRSPFRGTWTHTGASSTQIRPARHSRSSGPASVVLQLSGDGSSVLRVQRLPPVNATTVPGVPLVERFDVDEGHSPISSSHDTIMFTADDKVDVTSKFLPAVTLSQGGDLILIRVLLHKWVWVGETVSFSPHSRALLGEDVVDVGGLHGHRLRGELKELPSS